MAIYRVFVRGRFGPLDDETRDRLLAELDRHDVLAARFTPEGSMTYERMLFNFTFRVEVRDPDEDAAAARAEQLAMAHLEREGIPYRDLRVSATDMASVWD
ncbi:MAG: hypothetical protein JWO68_2134 [Actinomycetia bacterium]|nr:hypothetical protein [Actinomycetes bacterium]